MLSYLGFKSVRSLSQVFDAFCKGLCAYSIESGWQSEKKIKADAYESCAHVFRIMWKARKMELEGARLGNFMLRHDDFVHPRVIFEPSTTLMAIDDNSVLFAVCDVDVHRHDVGPFFYINQFNHLQRLIRIPLKHFVHLMKTEASERVDENELNLILLSNVGRCGSTLLTQLFERLPQTVSISEPEVLMPFAADPDLFKNNSDFTRLEVLKSCILALVASSSSGGERKTNIVIKPKAHAIAITSELDQLFPRVRHLYLYRHPAQYVTSVASVFSSLMHPVVRSAVVRFSIKMDMKAFVMTHFLDHTTPRAMEISSLMDKIDMKKNTYRFAALFCANVLSAQEQRERYGLNFKVVSYHELIKESDSVMADVSRFCEINGAEEAASAVELPKHDSQNNSGLSRQHLHNFKKSLDEAKISEIDHVLKACRLAPCETFPIDSRSFDKMLDVV